MIRGPATALALAALVAVGCDSGSTGAAREQPVTTAPREDGPAESAGLVLRGDGIEGARFGDDPDEVIGRVTAHFGDPDEDSGWVDPFSEFGTCTGTRARAVVWSGLQLIFTDDSGGEYAPTGTDQFVGYSARTGRVRLVTDRGLAIGGKVADVRVAYPDAEVFEDDVFGAQATTDDGLWIVLTATSDDGAVDAILGGQGCGE